VTRAAREDGVTDRGLELRCVGIGRDSSGTATSGNCNACKLVAYPSTCGTSNGSSARHAALPDRRDIRPGCAQRRAHARDRGKSSVLAARRPLRKLRMRARRRRAAVAHPAIHRNHSRHGCATHKRSGWLLLSLSLRCQKPPGTCCVPANSRCGSCALCVFARRG